MREETSLKLNNAFWEWFGNSVVINNGEPIICYHASKNDFNIFKINRNNPANRYGSGIYFSNSENNAIKHGKTKAYIYKCYLKIEKPLVIDHRNNQFDYPEILFKLDKTNTDKELQQQGYDGIIAINDNEIVYVIFNSNQVKSIDNQGTWSSEENIYESFLNSSKSMVIKEAEPKSNHLFHIIKSEAKNKKDFLNIIKEDEIDNVSEIVGIIDRNSDTQLNYNRLRKELYEWSSAYIWTNKIPVNKLFVLDEDLVEKELERYQDFKIDVNTKPIVVLGNWEVLDGRHRTVQAKKQGLKYMNGYVPADLWWDAMQSISESIENIDRTTSIINNEEDLLKYLKEKKKPQRITYDSKKDWYIVSSNDQLTHDQAILSIYNLGYYGDISISNYIRDGINRGKNNTQNPTYLYCFYYSPQETLYKNFFDGIDHGYVFKNFGTIYTKGFEIEKLLDLGEPIEMKESVNSIYRKINSLYKKMNEDKAYKFTIDYDDGRPEGIIEYGRDKEDATTNLLKTHKYLQGNEQKIISVEEVQEDHEEVTEKFMMIHQSGDGPDASGEVTFFPTAFGYEYKCTEEDFNGKGPQWSTIRTIDGIRNWFRNILFQFGAKDVYIGKYHWNINDFPKNESLNEYYTNQDYEMDLKNNSKNLEKEADKLPYTDEEDELDAIAHNVKNIIKQIDKDSDKFLDAAFEESLDEEYINVSSAIRVRSVDDLFTEELMDAAKKCSSIYDFENKYADLAQDCELFTIVKGHEFSGYDLEDLVDNIRYTYEDAIIEPEFFEWKIDEENKNVWVGNILIECGEYDYNESLNEQKLSDMLVPKRTTQKPLQVKYLKKTREGDDLFINPKTNTMYTKEKDGKFYNMKHQEVNREFEIINEKLITHRIQPRKKFMFDDMEDETGMNMIESSDDDLALFEDAIDYLFNNIEAYKDQLTVINMQGKLQDFIKYVKEEYGYSKEDLKLNLLDDLTECMSSAQMGPAPTAAIDMVQTKVNGNPVAGKSVKKKKIKESLEELNQMAKLYHWEDDAADPEYVFKHADNPENEFEDALDLIQYGQDEDERAEYKEYLDLFKRTGKLEDYLKYCEKKGYDRVDVSLEKFGLREDNLDQTVIEWLDNLNFTSANSKIGFRYYYEGNYLHTILYDRSKIQYKIIQDDKTIYNNAWYISSFDDVNKAFKEIEKELDAHE